MDPLLISSVVKLGGNLIDKIFPDPEEAAKAKLELLRLEQQGDLKELEVRMSAILAEAQSSDKWTSRARPTFMYLFYILVTMLVLVFPLIGIGLPDQMSQFYVNVDTGFKAIPSDMWTTFTLGFLGYAGFRTYEKKHGVAK